MKFVRKKVSNILGASALGLSIVASILLVPAVAVSNTLLLSIDIIFMLLFTMIIVNKIMAKKWHNKHISTKWGVSILGFLIVSLALLIPVLQQNQIIQSDAATSSACKNTGGYCMASGFCKDPSANGYKNAGTLNCTNKTVCCVPTNPQARCQNAGGRLIKSNKVIYINNPIVLFRSGDSTCAKQSTRGCSIVYGENSTAKNCKCADWFSTGIGRIDVKSLCGSGLYCKKSIQVYDDYWQRNNYQGTCAR